MMGDIMYFYQVIMQSDTQEFVNAIIKEVEAHIRDEHWKLVKQSKELPGTYLQPSMRAMYCKWNLMTNKIRGHKARLNIHGSKQMYGMKYYETYSLIVTWFAIWCIITLANILAWAMWQINFVQAYTPGPIEHDMYM